MSLGAAHALPALLLENPDLGEEPLSQEELNKIGCQNNWTDLLKLKNDVEDSDGKQE